MWTGITTAQVTCGVFSRRSVISASVKPLTANLAAAYAVCDTPGPSVAQKPLTLLTLTMQPSTRC